MGEYLYGWKRKAGIATLVAASFVLTLWVRSLVVDDHLLVRRCTTGYEVLESLDGRLIWGRFISAQTKAKTTAMQVIWPKWESRNHSGPVDSIFSNPNIRSDGWQWFGIEASSAGRHFPLLGDALITVVAISYGAILIPLTLISTWLLLSKPKMKPNVTLPSR